MTIDPDEVALRIAEVAERVILPRYGRLKSGDVRMKSGPRDLVTRVDEEAEEALSAALSDLHPGAAFLGEELASRDSGAVGRMFAGGALWIVDPLDGTRNFINGVDEFGVIVALVEGGATRMGWIYAVPQRACAIAVEGGGATLGGETIVPKPAKARLEGIRNIGYLPPKRQDSMRQKLALRYRTRAGNCSAYAYLDLARGLVDFKIASRIHPWDHAAGALLVAETGGRVAFLDGGPAYAPGPTVDAPLLGAAAGRGWDEIAKALRD